MLYSNHGKLKTYLARYGTCTAVKPTEDCFSDPNFFADINELLTGLEFVQLFLCRGLGRGGKVDSCILLGQLLACF